MSGFLHFPFSYIIRLANGRKAAAKWIGGSSLDNGSCNFIVNELGKKFSWDWP